MSTSQAHYSLLGSIREGALATGHCNKPFHVMAVLELISFDFEIVSNWFFPWASYLKIREYIAA